MLNSLNVRWQQRMGNWCTQGSGASAARDGWMYLSLSPRHIHICCRYMCSNWNISNWFMQYRVGTCNYNYGVIAHLYYHSWLYSRFHFQVPISLAHGYRQSIIKESWEHLLENIGTKYHLSSGTINSRTCREDVSRKRMHATEIWTVVVTLFLCIHVHKQ